MSDGEEAKRVSELKGYGVLDSPNEAEFDAIVREAAQLIGTPAALISLIDDDRQWFKARYGIDATDAPRSISFCTHAIRGDNVLVVTDAREDQRFAENPHVTGDPHIRFYAGAPLRTSTGRKIGTLCVFDYRTRQPLEPEQIERLEALSALTMDALERRRERKGREKAR